MNLLNHTQIFTRSDDTIIGAYCICESDLGPRGQRDAVYQTRFAIRYGSYSNKEDLLEEAYHACIDQMKAIAAKYYKTNESKLGGTIRPVITGYETIKKDSDKDKLRKKVSKLEEDYFNSHSDKSF